MEFSFLKVNCHLGCKVFVKKCTRADVRIRAYNAISLRSRLLSNPSCTLFLIFFLSRGQLGLTLKNSVTITTQRNLDATILRLSNWPMVVTSCGLSQPLIRCAVYDIDCRCVVAIVIHRVAKVILSTARVQKIVKYWIISGGITPPLRTQ